MKFLFVSNLFPDTREPARGLFNARLVKYLSQLHELRVISPRPAPGWLPSGTRTARPEDEKFIPIFPPTGYLPRIGDRWNHLLMAGSLRGPLEQTRKEFPFQAILAAWAYPDCCAIAQLAAKMKVPFVALVQGSDAHQYLNIPVRRRIIVESLNTAAAVVAQSLELQRLLREAGVKPEKLHTIYNGVEQDAFKPGDRAAARAGLNLPVDDTLLLYVGNLLPVKNPLLLIEAHAILVKRNPGRSFRLVMIGTGPLRGEIQRRTRQLGTDSLVHLAGGQPPELVARHMQAADVVCIPSDNEGLPNVLNEAFSCGRRVAATRVGGIPEILSADFLGRTVARRDPAAMAGAVEQILAEPELSEPITGHIRRFSWENCAAEHARLLEKAAQTFHYQ